MNRKFRELIPLFAICLMIIGAITLLIVINSEGTEQVKNEEKNSKKKVMLTDEDEEKIRNNDKNNKEVSNLTDEETIVLPDGITEPVVFIKDTKEEVNIKDFENKKDNSVDISNVSKTSNTTKSYIKDMVDSFIPVTPSTSVNTNANTNTTTNNVKNEDKNKDSNEVVLTGQIIDEEENTVKPEVKKTTEVKKVITSTTQSRPKKEVAPVKEVELMTVYVGSYKVFINDKNNIVLANSNGAIVSRLDIAKVSMMKVCNSSIYVLETKGNLKKFDIVNGTLKLKASTNRALDVVDFRADNDVVIMVKTNGSVTGNKIIENAITESGILRVDGKLFKSVSSVSSNTVTLVDQNDSYSTYRYNGITFE